ncbi:MAG: SET domain-containing protein [Bacteroidetes bacterium]|nr:SET domain-containing protein [Bacteroidota bacterium]
MIGEDSSASYLEVIERLSKFLSWSVSNGIQVLDAVRVDARWDGVSKMYTLCIVSTRHLHCFEKLLSIPKTVCLGAKTCSISKELVAVGLGGGLALNFAIAQELALGPDSCWFDYLCILPSKGEQSLPMFWSKQERKKLKGTSLYSHIIMDDQSFADDYEFGFKLLQKYINFKSDRVNFELYKKAVSIAASRAFYIDEYFGECLIPWADLFNHSTHNMHVKVYCSKSSSRNTFDMDENEVLIRSVQSVRKYQELFNTFGLQSNSSLLHKYGFCELSNKNGFVSIYSPFGKLRRDKTSRAWSEV